MESREEKEEEVPASDPVSASNNSHVHSPSVTYTITLPSVHIRPPTEEKVAPLTATSTKMDVAPEDSSHSLVENPAVDSALLPPAPMDAASEAQMVVMVTLPTHSGPTASASGTATATASPGLFAQRAKLGHSRSLSSFLLHGLNANHQATQQQLHTHTHTHAHSHAHSQSISLSHAHHHPSLSLSHSASASSLQATTLAFPALSLNVPREGSSSSSSSSSSSLHEVAFGHHTLPPRSPTAGRAFSDSIHFSTASPKQSLTPTSPVSGSSSRVQTPSHGHSQTSHSPSNLSQANRIFNYTHHNPHTRSPSTKNAPSLTATTHLTPLVLNAHPHPHAHPHHTHSHSVQLATSGSSATSTTTSTVTPVSFPPPPSLHPSHLSTSSSVASLSSMLRPFLTGAPEGLSLLQPTPDNPLVDVVVRPLHGLKGIDIFSDTRNRAASNQQTHIQHKKQREEEQGGITTSGLSAAESKKQLFTPLVHQRKKSMLQQTQQNSPQVTSNMSALNSTSTPNVLASSSAASVASTTTDPHAIAGVLNVSRVTASSVSHLHSHHHKSPPKVHKMTPLVLPVQSTVV